MPMEQDRRTEGAILGLLLDSQAGGWWSVEEMVSQLGAGSRVQVVDGLARLQADGLVHRMANFVFPTRAAVSFDQLPL
jgi:hypothetical protein